MKKQPWEISEIELQHTHTRCSILNMYTAYCNSDSSFISNVFIKCSIHNCFYSIFKMSIFSIYICGFFCSASVGDSKGTISLYRETFFFTVHTTIKLWTVEWLMEILLIVNVFCWVRLTNHWHLLKEIWHFWLLWQCKLHLMSVYWLCTYLMFSSLF